MKRGHRRKSELSLLAEQHGVKPSLAAARVRRGWTVDEAVGKVPRANNSLSQLWLRTDPDKRVCLSHAYERHAAGEPAEQAVLRKVSIAALARKAGLKENTVRSRLQRGWNLKSALEK